MMEKKYLSIDKIVGKEVIDSNATIIGNVKDMSFDLGSKAIALTVQTRAGTDILVRGENIAIMGDVVLLNKIKEEPAPSPREEVSAPKPQVAPPSPIVPGLCSVCGYQNDTNAKFCIKCGSKLK